MAFLLPRSKGAPPYRWIVQLQADHRPLSNRPIYRPPFPSMRFSSENSSEPVDSTTVASGSMTFR